MLQIQKAVWANKKYIPKELRLTNEILPYTLNISTKLVHGIVPKLVEITSVRVIAGKGVETEIRDKILLYNLYGGDPDNWVKKGGVVLSNNFKYDIHWYENGKIIPEQTFKLKGVKSK